MDLKSIHEAIEKVDGRVITLIEEQAKHNEILRTHENRSLALQKAQDELNLRLKPIESHVTLLSGMLKIGGMLFVAVAGHFLIKYIPISLTGLLR